MKKFYTQIFLILFTEIFLSKIAFADNYFFSASCNSPFPETMLGLHELIKKQGYHVSRVQAVDKGLIARGYKTGFYRVVFFGKNSEIQLIRKKYPALLPYIPLSITIFENGEQTGISAIDPAALQVIYASDDLKSMTERWSKHIIDIFNEYKKCQV